MPEDVITQQPAWFPDITATMTLVSVVSRFIRLYVFSTEMILLMAFIFILYNFLPHVHMWKMMQSARVKMQLKIDGQNGTTSNGRKFNIGKENTDDGFGSKDKVSWELKRENVGVFAIQGRRPHMEDRFNIVSDFEHTGTSIYGIFDGHGGEFAADFVEKTLLKSLMIRLLQSENGQAIENAGRMLIDQVLEVDKQLLKLARASMPIEMSGTTSLVALVQNSTLTVANTGDSRGVICDRHGKVIPLSFDHKPHQVKERMRIQQAGGFISFNGVWRVAGVLATSRALGDLPLKDKHFVIADPDILTFNLHELEPSFMILATDGLWDYFSNEEAAEFVSDRLSEPHFGAKSLVLQAYYRGSPDNITVMVVDFQKGRVSQYGKPNSHG